MWGCRFCPIKLSCTSIALRRTNEEVSVHGVFSNTERRASLVTTDFNYSLALFVPRAVRGPWSQGCLI